MRLLPNFEIKTFSKEGIAILYDIFKNDFIDNQTFLTDGTASFPIDIMGHEMCPCPFGGCDKPKKFWHVITRDKKNSSKRHNPCIDPHENKRAYDKARAVRIHWIKKLVDSWQSDNNLLHYYQDIGNNKNNLVIWHKNEDFLVIIRKIGTNTNRYLVTSYVIHQSEKYRYTKKLENYMKNKPIGVEWF